MLTSSTIHVETSVWAHSMIPAVKEIKNEIESEDNSEESKEEEDDKTLDMAAGELEAFAKNIVLYYLKE